MSEEPCHEWRLTRPILLARAPPREPRSPARRSIRGPRQILDAIGETPLIRIDDIWVKLEFLNPSGSIKARIAKYMIERAEREGLLRPGDTIVEASSGNTGNAMSMVAAVKGYRMLVVMPDGMSPERMAISRAFGAEVLNVGDFHVTEALERARESGRSRDSSRRSSSTTSGTSTRTASGWGRRSCARCPPGSCPTRSSMAWARAGRSSASARRSGRSTRRAHRGRRTERVVHVDVRRGRQAPHRGHLRRLRAGHRRPPSGVRSTSLRRRGLGRRDRRDAPDGPRVRPLRRSELRREPGRGPCLGRPTHDAENVVTLFCDEGEKYITDYFREE